MLFVIVQDVFFLSKINNIEEKSIFYLKSFYQGEFSEMLKNHQSLYLQSVQIEKCFFMLIGLTFEKQQQYIVNGPFESEQRWMRSDDAPVCHSKPILIRIQVLVILNMNFLVSHFEGRVSYFGLDLVFFRSTFNYFFFPLFLNHQIFLFYFFVFFI